MTSITVVTPTYNRRAQLARCLDALANQSVAGFEVIVVDDASPEPVAQWLDGDAYPFELTVLRMTSNGGPARARNRAAAAARGEVLAFVDDDVVADRGLLAAHLASLERLGPHGVSIGPLAAPPDWKPTPWNRWEAETIAVEYRRMVRGDYAPTWRQFFTGNAMLRRDDFLDVGGFDESFKRAEDIEFAYRLSRRGATFGFEPGAIGWHYAERPLASWRRIPSQYAEFDLAIDRIHPELRWQQRIAVETRRRHWLTRGVDSAASLIRGERTTAGLAIGVARIAHAARMAGVSSPLLSLAFQLEYNRAHRELTQGQRFNAASTAAG